MTAHRPLSAPLDRPIRLAVLISGGGTTLTNLVARITAGTLSAAIPLVIASRPDCGGIARAKEVGLRCEVIERKGFANVNEFSEAIFGLCREAAVDLVVCGGFLSLLTVPADYSGRVMNIHPSLIPAFSGKGFHGHHVHEAVLARGAKVSGCTVHFVDDEYDHGPIIAHAWFLSPTATPPTYSPPACLPLNAKPFPPPSDSSRLVAWKSKTAEFAPFALSCRPPRGCQ